MPTHPHHHVHFPTSQYPFFISTCITNLSSLTNEDLSCMVVFMDIGWLTRRRHLYQNLADQAVITTWSETSIFHLLRQASSTQKHNQQSSPPRCGPIGTWQDGDRKHLPLSLLLRATCWPLYLCLNYYCFCWLRRHAMLSLRTQVEILTSRIIPKWGIGTEKSSSWKGNYGMTLCLQAQVRILI